MKKDGNKIYILIISFILCLGLVGCSKQASPQSQEVADIQNVTPYITITDKTAKNGITDSDASDNELEESNIDTPSEQPDTSDTSEITKDNNGNNPYTDIVDSKITPVPTAVPRVTGIPAAAKPPAVTQPLTVTKPPAITKPPAVTQPPIVTQPLSDTNGDDALASSSDDDFVAKLAISADINQLVCVIGSGGSDCKVSFHVKDSDGIWTQQFSTEGECGSKGITYHKKEGDGKTPAGLYSFTMAFGLKSDPGAKLIYRRITEYDYWLDDIKSPYYNTWVNSLEIPGDYTSEHLIDHAPQYNYALNINYNPDCIPGLGSAIFLHGFNGLGHTTGCIAISEKYVKTLIQNIDSAAKILIVPDNDDLKNYIN